MVIPGEAVGGPGLKPGPGTFRQGDTIVASLLGVRSERDGIVTIIPANGRYMPEQGDPVIGEVTDFGPSHWLVDINAPYPAPLHATESPWDVEFGDTARYMRVGDVILAFILSVDEAKKVQLTMRDREARRVEGGILMQISPTKVPRVIGKQGSMISMIKEMTRSRIFVGQNGVIWIDGDDANAILAEKAIRFIEERAQAFGVTEAVRELLERSVGRSAKSS
jgi:exosome complex component RRP4